MLRCLVSPLPLSCFLLITLVSLHAVSPVFISHRVTHTPSLEKPPYSLPLPSCLPWGEAPQTKRLRLGWCCPCTETALTTFGKTSPQTVSIKPKQVPLTELPLFRLYGVHTWASVGWTCSHLTPNAQDNGAIKTHIKDAFFHCDGWKSHGCSAENIHKNISSLAVLYSHRSANYSLALK